MAHSPADGGGEPQPQVLSCIGLFIGTKDSPEGVHNEVRGMMMMMMMMVMTGI
jgi:hypothetical protein